jgi:hypothetical protein
MIDAIKSDDDCRSPQTKNAINSSSYPSITDVYSLHIQGHSTLIIMADCICLPRCPFFNDRMAGKPSTADVYKQKYCKGDSNDCARHIVFTALGKGAVPSDLYPNQKDRAMAIVSKGK